MEQLTKQQQDLVEKNHNLIYGFIHNHKLNVEEYYDILAIAVCKAAKMFDGNKSDFSTYAYNAMKKELYKYWRHINRQKFIPDEMILSYNAEYDNSSNEGRSINLMDYLMDKHSTHDIVIGNMMSEKLISMLKDSEKKVAQYLLIGMQQSEIAKILNCSRQNVNFVIQQIRKKWISYFNTISDPEYAV